MADQSHVEASISTLIVRDTTELLGRIFPKYKNRAIALAEVSYEGDKQDVKWGEQQGHSDLLWNAILGEERGEVERAILEHDYDGLRTELVQVAAVAVCWIEALDSRGRDSAVCA